MSQPYVGQIIMFGGSFAPAGWALCAGQLMPISENDTLFNLIGTTYGGDGESTFGLPNLMGRVPIHMGQGSGLSNYQIGQSGGTENVTLITQQIPLHNHQLLANASAASASTPSTTTILATESVSNGTNIPYTYNPYDGTNQVTMPSNSIGQTGGNLGHNNIQPVLAVTVCISLFGIYPSPT